MKRKPFTAQTYASTVLAVEILSVGPSAPPPLKAKKPTANISTLYETQPL